MEEFEEGAAQMKKMVDKHTVSGSDVPPANELSRMPLDHPCSSEETIDPINPEAGTNEEIKQAGQTAVAGAKIVKKKPVKKKKKSVKLHLKDKLVWTRKTAKFPYINARVEVMDELTAEEALTRIYKDAEGVSVLYKRSDLIYDLDIGRLKMMNQVEVNVLELTDIESDAVRTSTRELLSHNEEVALTLSLPTGTVDVLVTKKENYTRNTKEPKDLAEALRMPDAQQWKDAVIKELMTYVHDKNSADNSWAVRI
jgi:hypothetical protein